MKGKAASNKVLSNQAGSYKETSYRAAKKKIFAILLSISMFMCLAACGSSDSKYLTNTLELGTEVTSILGEMLADPNYLALTTSSEEIIAMANSWDTKDYDTPIQIYSISIDNLNTFFAESDLRLDDFSPELQQQLTQRIWLSAIPSMINSRNGMVILALTSTLTASKTFCDVPIKERELYLYVFEYGMPILIQFIPLGNDVCTVSGIFLYTSDRLSTVADVEDLFYMFSCDVQKVK